MTDNCEILRFLRTARGDADRRRIVGTIMTLLSRVTGGETGSWGSR
jgi:hypothetical protein